MKPCARLKAERPVEEPVSARLNHPDVIRDLGSGFVETAANELAPQVATRFIDGESLEELKRDFERPRSRACGERPWVSLESSPGRGVILEPCRGPGR